MFFSSYPTTLQVNFPSFSFASMGDRNVDYNVLERILTRSEGPRHLPLEILTSITDNFSEDRKIGRGGFSDVYKVKTIFRQRIINKMMQSMSTFHSAFCFWAIFFEWSMPNFVNFALQYICLMFFMTMGLHADRAILVKLTGCSPWLDCCREENNSE